MTFLNPLAGLLAAGVATPILLLFYFLKLRRRPLRVSSTLLWERAVRDMQVNEPFRWLRPSWMLLLQLLALWSLCAALARPAFDAPESVADRVIILIDASASMGAEADQATGATRLDRAKDEARSLIDRLSETTGAGRGPVEAAVVSFAATPRAETGLTPSRAELRRAAGAIEQTDQPGDLAAALDLAGVLLGSREAERASARVVVIGDGAYGGIVSTPVRDTRFVRVGPSADDDIDNLGIVAIAARRDLGDAARVRVFLRIVNASRGAGRAPVSLLLDGRVLETRTIEVGARTDEGPGEAAVTFEFLDEPAGAARLVTATIGRRDALAADNTAAVRLEPAIPPRVLIVTPTDRTEAQRLAHGLLEDAFAAIGSTIIDTIDARAYASLVESPGAFRHDLVVFDGVRSAPAPPTPSVAFGSRVGAFGSRVERESTGGAAFASWRRAHPALRNVSLDTVSIARWGALDAPGEGATAAGVTGETLAFGTDGPLITIVRDRGVERIFVGFELAQSNWPTQFSFVIFLTNAVERLTRLIGEASATAFTTTDSITVRPAPGATRIVGDGPAPFEAAVDPARASVALGALRRAGVYRLEGVADADRLLPVNLLDARESDVAAAGEIELGDVRAGRGAAGVAAPREVWRWFALAGLVLLTAEWLLYAWRMRI